MKLNTRYFQYRSLFRKFHLDTMIPQREFIENLRLIKQFSSVPGDYVECGVWRGGLTAAVAQLLGSERTYYLLDSFEGLPQAEEIDGIAAKSWQKNTHSPWYFNNCAAEESYSIKAMERAGCTNYKIIKGWFENTVPMLSIKNKIAILRLDADWYKSTSICLEYLFPQVNENGLIIIDDYYFWDGCSRAVHDYLSKIQSPSRIYQSHKGVCYLVKKSPQ